MSLGPGSSAILDLKAELLRKKNQAETKVRSAEKTDIFTVRKGGFRIEKRGPRNTEKQNRDLPPIEDPDEEALRESRRRLEEKSRLYEQRAAKQWVDEDDETLVDFNRKRILQRKQSEDQHDHAAKDDSDSDNDDEDGWTTFVDALGRTRKCLRSDLHHYLSENEKLSSELAPKRSQTESGVDEIPLPEENHSADEAVEDAAKQERLQRWDDIEQQNSSKEHLHYQDVLFDEIREHGQAHFEFSRDDAERAHQLKILDKLREESTKAQRTAQTIKSKREQVLKERLRKIRIRKGLPPEPESEDQPEPIPPPAPAAFESASSSRSSSHIRPWDEGKEVHGVPIRRAPKRDYVEDRRAERPTEFAPPTSYQPPSSRKRIDDDDVSSFLKNIRHNFQ